MKTIPNEMLVANAGSGKTYSLTTRMVTLLAHGVEPRKIAALTFTRKAAGEFLDAVFARLALAALEPDKLEALRRDTGLPGLDAAGCRAILQRLVGQMGGLCMGTIDSLFARIMRAFPLEAGLTGEFAILGEGELEASREEALAGLFRYYAKDDTGFRNLLDLVRQQSRRQGEREVFSLLLNSIASLHAKFLQTPKNVTWGRADLIWPGGSAILSASAPDVAAGALWQAISETHPSLSPEAAIAWHQNLALASSLDPGAAWSP
jgi:ATP-dependent exoDNAse (exonuclease V) beta subunit